MKTKFTSTIAGASLFISAMMLVGKGFGFFREILYAGFFGTGQEFDLYLVSAVFPLTLNLIIFFFGQNYFIPAYNRIAVANSSDIPKFFTQVLGVFILGGICLSLLMFLLSDLIITHYLSSAASELQSKAVKIFRIFLLTIPLSSGISIFSSYLHAKLNFKSPALSNLILNLSIILLVLAFTKSIGIFVIPTGYLIGMFIQFCYLFYKSSMLGELKFRNYKFNFLYIRSLITSSLVIIVLIESIGQLYMIVDRFFYSEVEAGGIASINYAQSLFLFPISIFSFALNTAIFPRISEAFSRNDRSSFGKILNDGISVSIIIFLPISFIFIFYGESIIRLVFERGNFSKDGTLMTFGVLRIYALSLIFYTVYTILNKMFYSTDLIKSLLVITLIGIFLKIIFNFIFVFPLKQNGLALSSTLSYISFFIMSFLFLSKKFKLIRVSVVMTELLLNLFNGLLSYILTIMIIKIFYFKAFDKELFSIFVFCILFFTNLYIINHASLKIITNTTNRIIHYTK